MVNQLPAAGQLDGPGDGPDGLQEGPIQLLGREKVLWVGRGRQPRGCRATAGRPLSEEGPLQLVGRQEGPLQLVGGKEGAVQLLGGKEERRGVGGKQPAGLLRVPGAVPGCRSHQVGIWAMTMPTSSPSDVGF